MSLFDGYVIVDWSSAGSPKTGADSIWIADAAGGELTLSNPSTRQGALAALRQIMADASAAGKRLFLGFDFAFGYPVGGAETLTAVNSWKEVWARIGDVIEDGPDNANNRFDAAALLNLAVDSAGPFWGNGLKRDIDGLPRKKPDGYGAALPPAKRLAEKLATGTQEAWKLSGVGSVGGQALTGIAMLERLRRETGAQVWPFEWDADDQAHVFVEVFPSLVSPDPAEDVKDAGQVRALAAVIAACDAAGRLPELMDAPLSQPSAVCREEGWIFGAGQAELLASAPQSNGADPSSGRAPVRQMRYERDPAAIYAQSFATVESEARLDRFPASVAPMVTRVIHSCGMVEIADRLSFSHDIAIAGHAALLRGAPVLCDCEMVKSGIAPALLPDGVRAKCMLNDPLVRGLAAEIGNTRSAAAVELWKPHIEGAVVVFGNAPTALFHLLELLDLGWPKPAAILGFPVGFVGAAESKAELARDPRGVPFMTLKGRRGGSAMAAASVNGLAAGLATVAA